MKQESRNSRKTSIQEWADPFFATEYFRDQEDGSSSFHDLQRLSNNFDRVQFKLEANKANNKVAEWFMETKELSNIP